MKILPGASIMHFTSGLAPARLLFCSLLVIISGLCLTVEGLAPALTKDDYMCVANINRGTVKGPFYKFSDAIKELNSHQGGPQNRQMICLMDKNHAGSLGMVADPNNYYPRDTNAALTRQQGGDAAHGIQSWWYGWNDIKLLAHMCESDCSETDVYNKGQWRCRGKVEYAANYKGEVLAHVNAASSSECCAACDFHATCNTWTYCSRAQGCGDGRYKSGHCDLKIQKQPNWRSKPQAWHRNKPEAGWVSGVMGTHDPVNAVVDGGPSQAKDQPWYCVPLLESGIMAGSFWDVEIAHEFTIHNRDSYRGPRMICEMTSCGPKADPRGIKKQTGKNGLAWWGSWQDVLAMNEMCDERCMQPAEPPPHTLKPAWYCVAAKSGNYVWGSYADISPALQTVRQAPAGSRNLCEMTQEHDGIRVDPNPRKDMSLPRTSNNFEKYWSDLKGMSRKCRWSQSCKRGPQNKAPPAQPNNPPWYSSPDDYEQYPRGGSYGR